MVCAIVGEHSPRRGTGQRRRNSAPRDRGVLASIDCAIGIAELSALVVCAAAMHTPWPNYGMVSLGESPVSALRIAAEVETLAAQYCHAALLGQPRVIPHDELDRVRNQFAGYNQHRPCDR